jgi:hypothetical protein
MLQIEKKIHICERIPHETGEIWMTPPFFNWYSGRWSPIGSTRHCGHLMAYCASPGWLWWWRNWWNDWQGKPKYSEKTCPNAALSTTNPTCCSDANPGRRGGNQRLTAWATAWPDSPCFRSLQKRTEWPRNDPAVSVRMFLHQNYLANFH